MYKQLYLGVEPQEDRLEREFENLKKHCERSRKSQFGKIAELTKMYQEIKYDLDTLKIAMCKKSDSESV
jgi:hypothetical protein